MRIVSSFLHRAPPKNVNAAGAPAFVPKTEWEDCIDGTSKLQGSAVIAGENGWKDGFFYWNTFPRGVTFAASENFLNRGITSLFNALSWRHIQHTQSSLKMATFKNRVAYTGYTAPYFNPTSISTIGLYAHAREYSIGLGMPNQYFSVKVGHGNATDNPFFG